MREIKFRAWHKGNKSFQYFDIKEVWKNGWNCSEGVHDGVKHNCQQKPKTAKGCIYATDKWLNKEAKTAFIPSCKPMQYTGLKDIYEGDIIEFEPPHQTERISKVTWHKKGFWAIDNTDEPLHYLLSAYPKAKVTGNIYENKELY